MYASADLVEIAAEPFAFRREEPRVDGIRIGAADQFQLDDVMGRNHPRVRRMKLAIESFRFQECMNLIDPFGDDEAGAFGTLGEKVAHRPPERAGHPHDRALLVNDREVTSDLANG